VRALAGIDGCVEPVLTPAEALLHAPGALRLDQPDGAGGTLRTVGSALAAAGLEVEGARPAPRLGQHTDEVLSAGAWA
jgi:crotonobetainyl-CoA:carnitine CoA-transferase CaiB-like acyl-CoA transferase